MEIHHRTCRGLATLLAWWWTGARCRGRLHRHLLAPQKCRHRGGRRRPRATRMWAQARDKQHALPEKTSGRSSPVRSPAGRAPPGCREPRPAKLTPRGGRRSGRPPSANSMMVPTTRLRLLAEASVAGEVDGLDVDAERATGGGFRRRPAAPAVVTYPGQRSPRRSRVPRRRWGPRSNFDRRRGRRISF
jgi:hypothetical protein